MASTCSASKWILVGLLLAAPRLAIAADSAAVSKAAPAALSLAEAWRTAFLNNWDLLAAKSDVDIATAQRLVAREFPNPSLSLGTSKISVDGHPNRTSQGNGLWDRSYDTVAAVGQLIELGGKRKARKDSAAAGLCGAEARLADARRLLDLAVTQAYVAAALADRNRRVLAESAASLRQEATIAAVRHRAGDISAADQSQIEIAAERLELDSRAADAGARTARIQLEILLGEREPHGRTELAETLERLSDASAGQQAAGSGSSGPDAPAGNTSRPAAAPGQTMAPLQRADYVAAEAARAKAEADLRLQKAQRVPDPTVSFQYEHEPPDLPNSVGLVVSLPLPLWNRNKGNVAAAEAAARQAATQAEKVRAQMLADIAGARVAFDAAQARWRRYREELEPKSGRVRESVALAYEKGQASLLDLLGAQRTDNEVRLATAQAAADAVSAAAVLHAALETLPTTRSNRP
jgi:cobalt-zinc-cadmium efflux system outer membrane protein